jgi:hypothetical protein
LSFLASFAVTFIARLSNAKGVGQALSKGWLLICLHENAEGALKSWVAAEEFEKTLPLETV